MTHYTSHLWTQTIIYIESEKNILFEAKSANIIYIKVLWNGYIHVNSPAWADENKLKSEKVHFSKEMREINSRRIIFNL